MSALAAQGGRWLSAAIRVLRKAGWPVALGLVAFLAGVLMLGASLLLASQSPRNVADMDAQNRGPRPGAAAMASERSSGAAVLDAPRYETHLDDVASIFAIAVEHGVVLGAVDYRTEAPSSLPVRIRTLDLHLAEDYPKFKPFVADLLARVTHLYLQEIRIDRGNVETARAQITLKVALVYRTSGGEFLPAPMAAISSPAGSAQP